jgi:glutamyl-tRNA synthetase
LGNLYGAFVDERLAHQSTGTFILRIEDTAEKRKVAGAEETIINSLAYYGLCFDEGVTKSSEVGSYGPYYQSNRKEIYQSAAKYLVSIGRAYPCFRTEEELTEIRSNNLQQALTLVITGNGQKTAI